MKRAPAAIVAIVIAGVMASIPFLGLDSLPRGLRHDIDSERSAFAQAQTSVQAAREQVSRDLQSEAELFQAIPESRQWPAQLQQAGSDLQSAGREMDQLSALQKRNRRQDRDQAQALLVHERGLRTTAVNEAATVQKEADHWVEMKRHLPELAGQMDRDHTAIDAVNVAGLTATVQKAATDWPDKKSDLDQRLSAIRESAARGDQAWQSSAALRQQAASGHLTGPELASLFGAADTLHNAASGVPKQAAEVQTLTGQLYTAWDKVLVDMEKQGHEYKQKLRTVSTRFPDATAKGGQTTSDDQWRTVAQATYDAQKNNLGMSLEHKAAGKYDSEADRVPQPAGFAYVAPPGQSNQYGRWERRDGRDFWVFYGQYALLRDLLFNRDYRPLDRGEWEDYRNYQSQRRTYYGRDEGGQKYGTGGTTTQDRYSGSTFAKSGGFRDSQYASKSGSFRDSRFASPGGDSTPKRFGKSSRPEEPSISRPPSSTFRPRSAPSIRPPMRSPGRRFGRR